MKYISLGAVRKASTEHIVHVSHCGYVYDLTGELAAVWLSGRLGFASTHTRSEEMTLRQLERMGLIVTADDCDAGEYRAFTRCRMIPAERNHPYLALNRDEKCVLTWLREAGLVLTMAELVFLMENDVAPRADILGAQNRQKLVERIYTKDTIFDNILENQMEKAEATSNTVEVVKSLLKKKRILLL